MCPYPFTSFAYYVCCLAVWMCGCVCGGVCVCVRVGGSVRVVFVLLRLVLLC